MKNEEPQLLKVSKNKRYLVKEDDTPFFWLGDTAWELFHKLNREEVDEFLMNRAERRFNVIQAVALAEMDGIRSGNVYGKKPLLQNEAGVYDPTKPDLSGAYSYWDHVDYVVDKAEELGMHIGFLPTWGDKFNQLWGKGPVIFDESNARIYGKWIGERYKDQSNMIWILGGDRTLETEEHYKIIRAMADGIREGDGGRHLMTFHPMGCRSSTEYVHEDEWLDFNMIQSGHSLRIDNYSWVTTDYELVPAKPTLDGEPRYEDHPINFKSENGFFDDTDVRQAAYWSVFAGSFGHTYGHHSIWSMTTEPAHYFIMTWQDAMVRPGGSQMQHVRSLIESRPFLERVPDQSLLVDELSGFNHLQATRGESYAFIYTPTGLSFEVNMGKISGEQVKAHWYDPRTGTAQHIGEFDNQGTVKFVPPSSGRGDDWVLVLDDSSQDFSVPGAR